jgi:DNA-binding XRE family transcriptional regulator
MREIGRLGGRATLAKHGREHLAELERKNVRAVHATYRAMPNLWLVRADAGLTQNELARRAGLANGSHVSRIERGAKAAPTTVARLAAALGVDEGALTG